MKCSLRPRKEPLFAHRLSSASAYSRSGLKLQKATSRSGNCATCAAVQSFSARTLGSTVSSGSRSSRRESNQYASGEHHALADACLVQQLDEALCIYDPLHDRSRKDRDCGVDPPPAVRGLHQDELK